MTSESRKMRKSTERGDFGFAMARNAAFLAVLSLWDKRKNAGLKQTELAKIIGRDPGWVNTQLKGPGNWTLRTFGEMVEALDGEVEIQVIDRKQAGLIISNFDAYAVHDEIGNTKTNNRFLKDTTVKPTVAKGLSSVNRPVVSFSGDPVVSVISQW